MSITRGAMVILGLEIGLSLVWLMSDLPTRAQLADFTLATARNVFHDAKVWTLVTSPFLQEKFLSLLIHGFVLFMFVPTLERFWGTPRFLRFAAITAVAGTVAGSAMGLVTGRLDAPINGLDPFINASIVAFGIVYARQPVQFFGVLPLTGRQLMYGFIAFSGLFILLQGLWELGAAYTASMGAAAIMTSKRLSPGLAWRRWRIARARARLSVIEGGAPKKPRDKEQKWLN
ncbi:MAG: rhomboid family intramembrane serine protease [Deltaproteobacteria bacterium]|nr:rhomboid family intramembrane serine protease [Deltaproteobacteria bacterium]